MRTGTGPAARGVRPRSGRGWSRAPPDPCARGTRRKSITTCTSPPNAFPLPEYHRWRPVSGLRRGHPVGADQGPVQAGVRLFPLAQPLKDLGKVRGPVGDHPQGLMQIPVGRGPAHLRVAGRGGQGGARHHPPQQEQRPGPGRWPPWATDARRAPCGGRPTTGRWCGRWTRERRQWRDRTPAPIPASPGALLVRKAQCLLSCSRCVRGLMWAVWCGRCWWWVW